MINKKAINLTFTRKAALTGIGILSIGLPILAGSISARPMPVALETAARWIEPVETFVLPATPAPTPAPAPPSSQVHAPEQNSSLAMVIVLDKSGSMGGPKIELAKEATRVALNMMKADQWFGVVTFNAAFEWNVTLQQAGNRNGILEAIARIDPVGETDMYPALNEAYKALDAVSARARHVIAITDGRSIPADYEPLMTQMGKDGISLTTIGVGDGADRNLLATLAELGHGRTYFISDALTLPEILARETQIAQQRGEKFSSVQPVSFVREGGRRSLSPEKPSLGESTLTAFGSSQSALSTHLQSPSGAEPVHFEVASVKANTSRDPAGAIGGCHGIDLKLRADGLVNGAVVPVGRCVVTRGRLGQLINIAFDLNLVARTEGLPDWDGPSYFNVEAKAENPAAATQAQLLLMLQRLLVDRFNLKFHFESRQMNGYALVVDKNGSRLRQSLEDAGPMFAGAMTINPIDGARQNSFTGRNISMAELAIRLTNQSGLHAPIVDKTGVAGVFDFELTYVLADQLSTVAADPSVPSIFRAVQEQLGLNLVPQKASIEYLIVDHGEKPAPNL